MSNRSREHGSSLKAALFKANVSLLAAAARSGAVLETPKYVGVNPAIRDLHVNRDPSLTVPGAFNLKLPTVVSSPVRRIIVDIPDAPVNSGQNVADVEVVPQGQKHSRLGENFGKTFAKTTLVAGGVLASAVACDLGKSSVGSWLPKSPSASSSASPSQSPDAPQSLPTKDQENNVGFHPETSWNWNVLNKVTELFGAPTNEQVLAAHGLKPTDVQKVDLPPASWEPALSVIELTPEKRGTSIELHEGFVYNVAQKDGSVVVYWGGDPKHKTVDVQWGFSARWVPSYINNSKGNWLSVDDPTEFMVREVRFGHNIRDKEQDPNRVDVPYFKRFGPYETLNGNLDLRGWTPPTLDTTIAKDERDAATMFGGSVIFGKWTHGELLEDGFLNWHWNGKDAGDRQWQTVYVPKKINGYVEIWLAKGQTGSDGKPVSEAGPYKFYAGAQTAQILEDGQHNVDEFTVHTDRNR